MAAYRTGGWRADAIDAVMPAIGTGGKTIRKERRENIRRDPLAFLRSILFDPLLFCGVNQFQVFYARRAIGQFLQLPLLLLELLIFAAQLAQQFRFL